MSTKGGFPGDDGPIIGIAPDVTDPAPRGEGPGAGGGLRVRVALAYAESVRAAGGVPVILSPSAELVPEYLKACKGFVFTGGDDPRMEPFGAPTHPSATPVHPRRQEFETALLRVLLDRDDRAVLGVCLGMQMMALTAGGELDQHLPETLATHAGHWGNAAHAVRPVVGTGVSPAARDGVVTSHHRQAVRAAGSLRVVARSTDGVIEAVDRPGRGFFVGVQWHPERTADRGLGAELFERLVDAARGAA